MAATDYFVRDIENFIRGYSTIEAELNIKSPKKILKDLKISYQSVENAKFLGKIEKQNAIETIQLALDEFKTAIQYDLPELCI